MAPLNEDLLAFEKLYKEHFGFLCLVAYQITKDTDASKDLVQDFFIYYWKKQKEIEINISFNAYATRAVKNLSIQFVEKAHKVALKQNETNLEDNSYELFISDDTEEEKIIKIRELVNQIPEARRKIFISHVVDGLTYPQIAETYGISVNTVKTQMKRSYAFLRSIDNADIIAVVFLLFLHQNFG